MFPILFQYKALSIGGYGVMLGLGFYFSFLLAEREFILRGKNPDLAYKLLLAAIPCGIIGSKLFHILEHIDEFKADPAGMIFSGAGLSAYGGILLSLLVCGIIVYMHKENFLELADIVAPSLMLGYCFGRFGCHVAGDGCYGVPSFGFFATGYPNGIVPSTITVLPTPLFEVFASVIFTGILLQVRKLGWKRGNLFYLYLILTGIPRFLVEFVRTNPKLLSFMTQAQVVSVVLILAGCAGFIYNATRPRSVQA